MTPAALSTYRILRSLDVPIEIQRKIGIAATGRPCFGRLNDDEFAAVMAACRRVYPDYEDLARQAIEPAEPPHLGG